MTAGEISVLPFANVQAGGATNGGAISLNAVGSMEIAGLLSARGESGTGGAVQLDAVGDVLVHPTAQLDASGNRAGGRVGVSAGRNLDFLGRASVNSASGTSGRIQLTAEHVTVGIDALLDLSLIHI